VSGIICGAALLTVTVARSVIRHPPVLNLQNYRNLASSKQVSEVQMS
jgi:hypothetical protein